MSEAPDAPRSEVRRADLLNSLGIDTWKLRSGAQPEIVVESVVNAGDFALLRSEVASCRRCELCETRTQTVFGVGDPAADCMIIGEAPGADEDRNGEPFVGAAGRLLNEMLRSIGLDRDSVFIANILKCRPPANRNPHAGEIEACTPYLEAQIEFIRPRLIIAVGRVAAHHLLDCDDPIGRLRGRVHQFGPAAVPLIVTYHPAYLLRSPDQKAKSWADLLLARECLGRKVAA